MRSENSENFERTGENSLEGEKYRMFQKERHSKYKIRWKNNQQRKLDAANSIGNTVTHG